MRPQKRYIAMGRAIRTQKRTGLLIADPYHTWEKEVARLNEAGRTLHQVAMKRLNGREYDKAARGTTAFDPIALSLLIPRGMSSIQLSIPGDAEPEDELLLKTVLEILRRRGTHNISTEELVRTLVEGGDPWVGRWGRAVTGGNISGPARQLADRLRLYRINPRTIRVGSLRPRKGYRVDDLKSGLSRFQRAQDGPEAAPLIFLRPRTVRPNPELVKRVLARVGVLGTFVGRLKSDREFLKQVLQHPDPHSRSLQENLKLLRSGRGFPIRFSDLPADLLTDASSEAMATRLEASLFENAGWQLRWCRHKDHLYVGSGRGRLPIDCPAHRYGGRKARGFAPIYGCSSDSAKAAVLRGARSR